MARSPRLKGLRAPAAVWLLATALLLAAQGSGEAQNRGDPAALPEVVAALQAAPQPLYAVPTRRDRSGRIAVPVLINGQGPFRFLLDTGANRSAITSALATRLGLVVSDTSDIIVNGVNGRVAVHTAAVPSMQLGAIEIGPQRLPVLDGQVFADLDGSLGADLLANLRLTADFANDRVTIAQSEGIRSDTHHGIVHARQVSGWLLQADGRARSAPFQMIVDTGATRTLGNRALFKALTGRQLEDSTAMRVDIQDATQTNRNALAISVSPIVLGDLIIENTYVTFGDFAVFGLWGMERKSALLLGMDVLGSLRELVIDYRRHELQVIPRGSSGP